MSEEKSPVVSPELERRDKLEAALEEIVTHSESALTCDLPSTESMDIEGAFEQIRDVAASALSNPEPLGITSTEGSLANAETLTPSSDELREQTGFASCEEKYKALELVHTVFATGIRKALRIDAPCRLSELIDAVQGRIAQLQQTEDMLNRERREVMRLMGLPESLAPQFNSFDVPSLQSSRESQPAAGVIPKSESLEPRGEPQLVDGPEGDISHA